MDFQEVAEAELAQRFGCVLTMTIAAKTIVISAIERAQEDT